MFVDHLEKPLTDYAKNQKIVLRIILVDLTQKAISLSEKSHLVKLKPIRTESLPVPEGAKEMHRQ